jgi:hypothetical protein
VRHSAFATREMGLLVQRVDGANRSIYRKGVSVRALENALSADAWNSGSD